MAEEKAAEATSDAISHKAPSAWKEFWLGKQKDETEQSNLDAKKTEAEAKMGQAIETSQNVVDDAILAAFGLTNHNAIAAANAQGLSFAESQQGHNMGMDKSGQKSDVPLF